jgi:hypothetical protein
MLTVTATSGSVAAEGRSHVHPKEKRLRASVHVSEVGSRQPSAARGRHGESVGVPVVS